MYGDISFLSKCLTVGIDFGSEGAVFSFLQFFDVFVELFFFSFFFHDQIVVHLGRNVFIAFVFGEELFFGERIDKEGSVLVFGDYFFLLL